MHQKPFEEHWLKKRAFLEAIAWWLKRWSASLENKVTSVYQRLMSRWRYQFSNDHWSQSSWAQPVPSWIIPSGECGVLPLSNLGVKPIWLLRETGNASQGADPRILQIPKMDLVFKLPEVQHLHSILSTDKPSGWSSTVKANPHWYHASCTVARAVMC